MLSLIFGVWPALSTAGHSLLRPSSAVSWWAGFWALAQHFWLGLTFAIYLNLLSLPLRRSFVRLLIQGSSAICMSEASSSDDVVELTLRLRGLRITVQGPAPLATDLAVRIPAVLDSPSIAGSVYSEPAASTVVSFAASTAPTGLHQPETRDEVLATFGTVPTSVLDQARRLGGGFESPEFRVRRAWLAG